MPTPSCQSSLTKSPLRPRKQKISRHADRAPTRWTVSASVFIPRRMSVTPPAIHRDPPPGTRSFGLENREQPGQCDPVHRRGHEQARPFRRRISSWTSRPAAAATGHQCLAPSSLAQKQGRLRSRARRPDTAAARWSEVERQMPRRRAVAETCRCPHGFPRPPGLVRIAPVPTTRRILGGQDLDLGVNIRSTITSDLSSPPAPRQTAPAGPLPCRSTASSPSQ